jgi:hypothetical protein
MSGAHFRSGIVFGLSTIDDLVITETSSRQRIRWNTLGKESPGRAQADFDVAGRFSPLRC